MNKQRLLVLADFLAKLKESDTKEFDMTTWGSCELIQIEEADPVEVDPASCGCKIERKDVFVCKTTACALGWATQIPSFKKAGLKMQWSNILTEEDPASGFPKYRGIDNVLEVAQRFFGLNSHEANFIFGGGGGGSHETPKETAKVIRNFVKGGLEKARGW